MTDFYCTERQTMSKLESLIQPESLAKGHAFGLGGPNGLKDAALRLLCCTARSWASSPDGLRFVADSKPWLENLPGGRTRQRPTGGGNACRF